MPKKVTMWLYGHPVEGIVKGVDPDKELKPGKYEVVMNLSQLQEAIVSEIMAGHEVIDSE